MTTNQTINAIKEIVRDNRGMNRTTRIQLGYEVYVLWIDRDSNLMFTDTDNEILETEDFAPFEIDGIYEALTKKYGRN